MRTSFIQELIVQARARPNVFLVVADLGFSVVEPYAEEFPDRYINVGVAEQNMTGVAAGLASEGYHVFTYSIANFPTLRCFEQIRNDVCYHRLPVTVVAVGAGMAYGNLGYSHHAVQDLGVMRTLRELAIYSPADPGETRACLGALLDNPGPSYLRLGKAGEPKLHDKQGFEQGPVLITPGVGDCAIVATGSVLKVALDALPELAAVGQTPPIYSCPWLQPLPRGYFAGLSRYSHVISLEEHLSVGGLSCLLREHLPRKIELTPLCVPDEVAHHVGSQTYLRNLSGLTPAKVVEAVTSATHAASGT